MSDSELLTLAGAAKALRTRRVSAVELTEFYLRRIERYGAAVNGFATLTADLARRTAAEADRAIGQGDYRGPLHGIPVAIKDVIDVAGVPTTGCSRLLQDYVPDRHSGVWAKLEGAGAVLLGKAMTHEFAIGGPSFDLPLPPARNPWDAARFTGGSSSGSGVLVAAGLAAGAVGSDSGGSIRTPASYCGIVGIKPTYGAVSRAGVLPLSASLDHVGPMTWTVEDNALMLEAMAGPDAADPTSSDRMPTNLVKNLAVFPSPLRIGYAEAFDHVAGVTDEVRAAVHEVLKTLEGLGAKIEIAVLPPLEDLTDCTRIILMAEAFSVHHRTITARAQDYGEVVRGRLYLGGLIGAADYLLAVRLRRELAVRMAEAAAPYDIIVSAATASPAPTIEATPKFAQTVRPPLVFPFNLTGAPALAMCCGFSAGGLPLSVQMAAKPFHEGLLYRVAHAYEQATPWRTRRPPVVS